MTCRPRTAQDAETATFLRLVQGYFQQYLAAQRGVSPHTIAAYRDGLKLYLCFVSSRTGHPVTRLTLNDLTAEIVLAFLDDLETVRQNHIVTRNGRLAALRTFFHYLVTQDPTRAAQYQAVLAIPLKVAPARPTMPYLERAEVQAIFDAINRREAQGRRDYVLLHLLYNTGARVQELASATVEHLRLTSPPLLTVTGKGRKMRQIPLWDDTATLVTTHLTDRGVLLTPTAPIVASREGTALTRFGIYKIIQRRVDHARVHCPSLADKRVSPHTFRHTTAMHLLQAGVDLVVVKHWLGHVHLETTHAYIEIDLAMKQQALAAHRPDDLLPTLPDVMTQHADVLHWLESLA